MRKKGKKIEEVLGIQQSAKKEDLILVLERAVVMP